MMLARLLRTVYAICQGQTPIGKIGLRRAGLDVKSYSHFQCSATRTPHRPRDGLVGLNPRPALAYLLPGGVLY